MGLGLLTQTLLSGLGFILLRGPSDLDLVSVDWELILNHKSILPESNLLSNIAKLGLAGKNQGSFLAPVDK